MYITNKENNSIFYVSVFISIILNFHRVVSGFNEINIILGYTWNFNIYELIFQILFQILFCYSIGFIFLKRFYYVISGNLLNIRTILIFTLIVLAFWSLGSSLQLIIYDNVISQNIFYKAYLIRITLSGVLMLLSVKFLYLNKQNNLKELENEKLKSSYLNSKLENLKDQINPHFLFNSFANLSALIDENQKTAKKYLSNLSDVFRYSLNNSNEQIVNLADELELLNSYIELYKIRIKDGLTLIVDLNDKEKKILSMSLQPLLENVIKHNEISKEKPVTIELKQRGNLFSFKNNLNQRNKSVSENGIGLSNLNERYKILVGKEIDIQNTSSQFIVTLPLV
ncbi:MAG: histidine kinase [Flammeovirgaceae bacterium]